MSAAAGRGPPRGAGALRRAFVAITPPPAVLDAVERLFARGPDRRFRWTRRDQWHITLQFFGRVRDPSAFTAALARACSGVPAVPVRLRGGGTFPRPERAEVLWLGVEDGDRLAALHERIIDAAGAFLARRDRAPFVPHLTVARLRRPTDLRADVDALAGVAIGPAWRADEVTLFESETRPDGAVHRPVVRYPLGR